MKKTMSFRVDTAALLSEIADNALPKRMGILKHPLNIFRRLLCEVAERAAELDDPKLNILMLSLTLYEVDNDKIIEVINEQKERLALALTAD